MDLLITKKGVDTKLTSLNLATTNVSDTSPTLNINQRNVTGRNGYVYAGATYGSKKIKVTGFFYANNIQGYELLKDELNGLLIDSEPFYVTKMLPSEKLYEFETPGQSSGDVDLLTVPNVAYKYRWYVICESFEPVFRGVSQKGLRFDFTITFTTAELPFGETKPIDLLLSGGNLAYAGTAPNSMLENNWYIELKVTSVQAGNFYLQVGGRRYEYSQLSDFNIGDILVISGTGTIKNDNNVNLYTNYEHFILEPSPIGTISYETNFGGEIRFLNFKQLYK